MKKNLALLLLLGILHMPFLAQAQTTYTPNLHLALPPAAPGTWGEQYNNNFSTLDSAITGTFGTAIAFSGDITPAQITADQTDYNPTGLSTANVLRLSSDAARSINSLAGGSDGRTIILYNVGAQEITLKNNSGIGSAANQFLLNADVVLGINQGAIVQYDSASARWRVASSIGTTGGGSAHVIQDEAGTLTARPTLNFTGAGVTCTDNSGSNRTDCTIAGGSTDLAAAYTWTGVHSWRDGNFSLLNTGDTSKILKFDLSGFTPSNTRTWSGPDASTRLLGDSDFSATGLMARTGAGTYAGRQIVSTNANEFTILNPGGVGGNIGIALGSVAAKTTASNTFSTGDQDFGAALSFTFPKAGGAAPSAEGRCAQDTTAHRLKCNFGSGVVTLAVLSEVQLLNANLTALSGLTGAANVSPVFTAPGLMTGVTWTSCPDVGGNHLNVVSISPPVLGCGTSTIGAISGGVAGTIPKYLSGTTVGTSIITEAASVVNVGGGFTVGDVATNRWFPNAAAVTGEKEWTIQNVAGIPLIGTTGGGAITDGHVVKFAVAAGVVSAIDGGVAGTGTWTDSTTNTGSNKTLIDALAGGGAGNVIKSQLVASFDGGGLVADGTNCQDPVKTTINSGPTQYTILCATPNSAVFDAAVIGLKQAVATFKVRLKANDSVSTKTLAGTFKGQCRASGTAPNSTWSATQTVSITLTTADNTYEGLTAAITPNGTCSAGADLYIRYNATGGSNSATTRIVGLSIEQQS